MFRQLQQVLAQLLLWIFRKELQIHAPRWILYRSCENHVFEFSRLNWVKLFPRVFQGVRGGTCPIWMVFTGLIKDHITIITVKIWGQSDRKYWRKRLKKSKISFVFQILSIPNFFPGCFRGCRTWVGKFEMLIFTGLIEGLITIITELIREQSKPKYRS